MSSNPSGSSRKISFSKFSYIFYHQICRGDSRRLRHIALFYFIQSLSGDHAGSPLQCVIVNPQGRCFTSRDIGKTVRVILSGVHGTGTEPNREAAPSGAMVGSRTNRTNRPSQIPMRHTASPYGFDYGLRPPLRMTRGAFCERPRYR